MRLIIALTAFCLGTLSSALLMKAMTEGIDQTWGLLLIIWGLLIILTGGVIQW